MKYVFRDGKVVPKPEGERRVLVQVMKDETPGRSPIDGTWLTSRSHIREHEKRHNVVQVGTDLTLPNVQQRDNT